MVKGRKERLKEVIMGRERGGKEEGKRRERGGRGGGGDEGEVEMRDEGYITPKAAEAASDEIF